ncbi:MAG TPA: histidine phosphatase family protein [Candidatus Agrococcus pullicola]|uniref:Histidine phosphatase family protein n=1 Tax=Candidatus Agrococcus pullicola TaxID=2838429 RepID=A0A9D1YYF4_9MICO|nr:histidine phosphatase family protein [Candidatus Agrococcus pullicola]
MTRIILIRHATADGHETADPSLSATGQQEATLLAARLRGSRAGHILHGPRRRAGQTASVLGNQLGCPVQQTDFLEDRTPHPSPERMSDYPSHRRSFLDKTPVEERDINGDTIAAAWRQLTELSTDRVLVAITHTFVVGSFVGHALGSPADAWLRLPIANASITEIQPRPHGEWAVVCVSDTGHLSV